MPAAFFINLSDDQVAELRQARRYAPGRVPERCHYVLLNGLDRLSCYDIAAQEQRDVRTIRYWINRYDEMGLVGLRSRKVPGRSLENRNRIKQELQLYLQKTPEDMKLKATHWTSALLAKVCQEKLNFNVSTRTVKRALKDLGWRYKRTRRAVPLHAPTSDKKKSISMG